MYTEGRTMCFGSGEKGNCRDERAMDRQLGRWRMVNARSKVEKKRSIARSPGCRSAGELQSRDRLRKRHPPGPQLEGGEGKDEDERFHRHLEHDD